MADVPKSRPPSRAITPARRDPSSQKIGGGRSRPPSRVQARPTWLRVLRWALAIGGAAIAVVVGIVVAAFLIYGADPDLPRIDRVADYQPKVVTRVTDKDGELLGEIFDERRTVVPREKIPQVMIHAIVDAEDAEFYQHKGLNYVGMLRALLNNLRPGAHLQGGSTITQQLVKTYLLKTNERTAKRKVQEVILARRLETKLSKDEILYLYLNQIYFGHQRYGVEEAARFYFGKSIADVNAGEAAVLASLPKGPEEISPLRHPERAKERQCYVLRRMVEQKHLGAAEAERFCKAPIQLVKQSTSVGTAPEFVDEARKVLVERFGSDKLATLGLTIRTTCDARVQKLAREALERGLETLDERQGYRKAGTHLKAVNPPVIKAALEERHVARMRQLLRVDHPSRSQKEEWLVERLRAFARGKIVEGVVVEVRPSTGKETPGVVVDTVGDRGFLPLPAAKDHHDRYNPKALPVEKRFAVGDVIFVRAEPTLEPTGDLPTLVAEFGPNAAAMVIDPQTREVRAIVGGYRFPPGGYDRAIAARRQPGSAFKPFLYATAFNSGRYTPASVLNDSPQVFEQPGLAEWKPKNSESHEFLGPVRLRVALAKSLNTVAAQLVYDLGPEALAQTAKQAGIESKLDSDKLALGLGASVVSLEELVNAYATFATGGMRAQPILIQAIGDQAQPKALPQQAMSPEIAYLVTSVMESVIDEGTGASAKGRLHRPAAGKTGTTSSERDAWFVGFTPDLVAGVWVGFDDMRDLGHGEQGARSALPIWVDIMNGALKGVAPKPFAQPPGIVVQRIDPQTGLLAPPGSATGMDEKFLAGTQPTQQAPEKGVQNPDTFIIDQ